MISAQSCWSVSPMILIGQYDSPFVRRVAIALRLYGLAFQHRPWSTFGDADKIAPFNPLRRGAAPGVGGGEGVIEKTAVLGFFSLMGGAPEGGIRPKRAGPRPAV